MFTWIWVFFTLVSISSCSVSNEPDYIGADIPAKRLAQNRIKIVSGMDVPSITDGEAPLPSSLRVSSAALLTLHNVDTRNIERVVSVREGVYEEIIGLPDGTYRLGVEFLDGKSVPAAPQEVTVVDGKFETIQLVSEKIEHENFYYQWEIDSEGQEQEYSLNDDITRKVVVLEKEVPVHNNSAAQILERDYNIILSDEKAPWSYDLASKLLREIAALPHKKLPKPAVFMLETGGGNTPLSIEWVKSQTRVTLNFKVFVNSSKKLVKLDGKRGRFFSLDLFKALVSFFTNSGKDLAAVNKILQEKFAITTNIPDYQSLTEEHADRFQGFHSEELIHLIEALAEMPLGYHKIPGLRYLVRRRNGHPHPIYPEAPAVAWPRGKEQDSYIEFMDSAFLSGSRDYIHRLILHEKSHFLWGNVFSPALKEDWIELGKWFPNPEVSSGWSTSDNLHFVSQYAHDINPNEDMAESLAHYVLNPEKLLALAPKKFRFIENNIMGGYQYVSEIREDLTFEVLNLFPDYDFPGKIRKVVVEAKGSPSEDKNVTITIELTNQKGVKDGAKQADMRIHSPQKTFKDIRLQPVNGNNHRLRGSMKVPSNAKNGYWKVENIRIEDMAGNERFEGKLDFGFKLYINNGEEDTTPPRYVAKSLKIGVEESVRQERQVFDVDITWNIDENQSMKSRFPVLAYLVSLDYPDRHRIEGYGIFNSKTNQARVVLTLTEYFPPGRYGVSYIGMQDRALNWGKQYFSEDPEHESLVTVNIQPNNPDYGRPVLDEDRITISAAPKNVQAPDGSTLVHINFYAKDDKSGLGLVHYRLKDPLGRTHFNYFIHPDTHTLFLSAGESDRYRGYRIETLLPKGSPPGTWGLMEIVLYDKAGNKNTYNFVRTIHFEIE